MKLEELKRPIQAQSVEEHERVLSYRMTEIQLEFVDRLFHKKIPPFEEEKYISTADFPALLSRYTNVIGSLMECYLVEERHAPEGEKTDKYDLVKKQFLATIAKFHEANPENWIQETLELIRQERKRTEALKTLKSTEGGPDAESDERGDVAGIMNFNAGEGYPELLGKAGIRKEDVCISVHLTPLYKTTLTATGTNIFSSRSLEKLALQIIGRYPETKAVTAKSWIVDTPIGKRIGFNVCERAKYAGNDSFWGQFINSNGQIDEIRVRNFLETGKAPYAVATGFMLTEDFLKKYLPKDVRRNILLKEINPAFNFEEYEHELVIFRELNTNWDSLGEEDLKRIFSQCPTVEAFDASASGRGFFDFLFELKLGKKTEEQIIGDDRLQRFRQSFHEFVKDLKFRDKPVII
jgi:hypothetical protein